MKKFKYPGVMFMSQCKIEREIDRWIGVTVTSNAEAILDCEEGAQPDSEDLSPLVNLLSCGHELSLT